LTGGAGFVNWLFLVLETQGLENFRILSNSLESSSSYATVVVG
jgi:hypothetical protein